MIITILLSALFGFGWHVMALNLWSRNFSGSFEPIWLIAGISTGITMGFFTVWTSRRNGGKERILHGFISYCLAIVLYWLYIQIVYFARELIWFGELLNGIRVSYELGLSFLYYGTMFAPSLIPLCFVCRLVVWKTYQRANPGSIEEAGTMHIYAQGEQCGPYYRNEVIEMINEGKLSMEDFGWIEGTSEEWTSLDQLLRQTNT